MRGTSTPVTRRKEVVSVAATFTELQLRYRGWYVRLLVQHKKAHGRIMKESSDLAMEATVEIRITRTIVICRLFQPHEPRTAQ